MDSEVVEFARRGRSRIVGAFVLDCGITNPKRPRFDCLESLEKITERERDSSSEKNVIVCQNFDALCGARRLCGQDTISGEIRILGARAQSDNSQVEPRPQFFLLRQRVLEFNTGSNRHNSPIGCLVLEFLPLR